MLSLPGRRRFAPVRPREASVIGSRAPAGVPLLERACTTVVVQVVHLARTILCLALVVALAVALRHGLYAHFHGDGSALTSVLNFVRR